MNKKQVYEEKLQAQLDEFNAQLELFKAKASKMESSSRLNVLTVIEGLKLKRDLAKNMLQELHESSDDAWEDLKEGVENAWADFNAALKAATSHFQ